MKIYCPYCRKDVEYVVEKRDVKEFRKIQINSYENIAICKECNNDLYVNEIEEKNNERLYKIYIKKTNIIKPEDIIEFRKKYNISQRELTSILGFGKMTINRYERGLIPTKSQSDYIKLLINNETEFYNKVKEAYDKGNITKKTFEKIMLLDEEHNVLIIDIQDIFRKHIKSVLVREPNIYNGYKILDLEKIENIISYIASKVKNLTITSLNKYLWFIDMISFNEKSVSITGLTYERQKFGPTIIEKKYNEISFLNEKYIREDFENENGTITKIISNKNYDLDKLTTNEIEIVNKVIRLLKDKKVTEISELSHKEDGWKKTKEHEKISFEYAINLNILK